MSDVISGLKRLASSYNVHSTHNILEAAIVEIERLRDCLQRANADYTALRHKVIQDDQTRYCGQCRLYEAEIKQLRKELADSVSRETVIATEQERDEARKAAFHFLRFLNYPHPNTADLERWPWLEE